MGFVVIPSVDVKEGRCVRLIQGDYAREIVYDGDPAAVTQRWLDAGASLVHIVDLNGARGEFDVNRALIDRLLDACPHRLQIGGGLRTLDRVAEVLERGAVRAVLGSAALRTPDIFDDACRRWPGQIALDLAAKNGKAAIEGWTQSTQTDVADLAQRYLAAGLDWIVYTDVHRDGMLQGPNVESLAALVRGTRANVIASGGISSIDHVLAAQAAGAAGAIVGRALYDGKIDYRDALHAIASA